MLLSLHTRFQTPVVIFVDTLPQILISPLLLTRDVPPPSYQLDIYLLTQFANQT
jgi:hypothetical protein